MSGAFHITRVALSKGLLGIAALGLSACLFADIPYDGDPRTTFIFENGQRAFTVFVFPRTTPENVVVEAALDEAHPFCAENFDTTKVELMSLQPGSLSAPSQWEVRGRCA